MVNGMNIRTLLFAAALAFVVLPACARTQSDRETLIREILAASGTREKADQVAVEVRQHFAPIVQGMSEQPAAAFHALAERTFAGDSIYALVEQYWLDQVTDIARLRAVHSRLSSPDFARMQQLEQEAFRPEAASQIAEYIGLVQKDSTLRRRGELLMTANHDAVQSTVRFLGSLTEQVFLLLNDQTPADQQMTAQDIHAIVDNMKAGMTDYYRTSMLGFYAYAYRSVPEEELQRYVDFYTDTDEGKWYVVVANAAYDDACNRTAQQFIRQLRSTYTGMRQQTADTPPQAPPVPLQQDEGEMERLQNDLRQKSNGGKIIGMMEATVNSVKWYGYLNAEDNHNGTITILALNNELDPMEQIEVTFSFKGTGTYRIEKQFAGIFRVTAAERKVVSDFYSRGAAADHVTITSYDKLTNMIEGKLEFTAYGKDGDITFKSQPFSVRIR